MRTLILTILTIFAIVLNAHAQFFAGLGTDPNSGIYALNLQPANMINYSHKWQITALGADFSFRSENFKENFNTANANYVLDIRRLFEYNDNSTQLFAQAILPSVLYSPNDKNVFSLSFGLRTFAFSVYNQPEVFKFVGGLINGGQWEEDLDFSGGYSQGVANAWFEAKFNYARVLHMDGRHKFIAGGAFKYLSGAASGFVELEDVNIRSGTNSINSIDARVRLVYNSELDGLSDDPSVIFDLFNRSTVGFDFGLQYFLYNSIDDAIKNDYKLSLGFSVLDIGSIKYNPSNNSAEYDLQGRNISLNYLDDVRSVNEVIDSLDAQFDLDKKEEGSYKIKLPIRYSLSADYKISKGLWLSVMPTYWPVINDELNASHIFSVLVTPRYKWKKLSLFLPIYGSSSIRNIYGFTAQWDFITLGSSNLWNMIFDNDNQFINLFLGLSFKINKKRIDREFNPTLHSSPH